MTTPSKTLRRVSKHLAQEPWGFEVLQTLAYWDKQDDPYDHEDPNDWENFDLADAVYWLSYIWHGGQWSGLYAAGCQTLYQPGCLDYGPEEGTVGEMIYQEIEAIVAKTENKLAKRN